MADSTHTDKTDSQLEDRVWKLAEKVGTCMLVTWDGEAQQARPMAANVSRDDHAIYFLTDRASNKIGQAEKFPRVTATFADNGGDKFVTISGVASIRDDRAKIKELWTPFAKAWWPSADDPAIRLFEIQPDRAELWDGPNKLVAAAIMFKAALTGKRPDMGDHAKVKV